MVVENVRFTVPYPPYPTMLPADYDLLCRVIFSCLCVCDELAYVLIVDVVLLTARYGM